MFSKFNSQSWHLFGQRRWKALPVIKGNFHRRCVSPHRHEAAGLPDSAWELFHWHLRWSNPNERFLMCSEQPKINQCQTKVSEPSPSCCQGHEGMLPGFRHLWERESGVEVLFEEGVPTVWCVNVMTYLPVTRISDVCRHNPHIKCCRIPSWQVRGAHNWTGNAR